MNVSRHRLARLVIVTVVASMPLLGVAGVASAKTHHHHHGGSGGSTGGGKGGPTPLITVTVDPNPLVETGPSEVVAVIQVETSPSFAGDAVNVDSSQLQASCPADTLEFLNNQFSGLNQATLILDNDGNASVVVYGLADCAPGSNVVEADLEVAPFYTALTTLTVLPPEVTPEGLTGFPQTSGVAQEVETGDTSASGDSDVYAVFYVETDPVYAEQLVEISSSQLEARCILRWHWEAGNRLGRGVPGTTSTPRVTGAGVVNSGVRPSTFLDDDGNAVFVFSGVSCATGTSEVIADVLAGTHPTYVSEFTVLPPAPTI